MPPIERRIRICSGHPTIAVADLAALYGVSTRTLMESMRKHGPAPGEYVFLPDDDVIPRDFEAGQGGGYVFTEHGAIAAACTLGTEGAVRESLQVLRAFVRFRKALAERGELTPR